MSHQDISVRNSDSRSAGSRVNQVRADFLVVGNRGMQDGRRFLGSVPNGVSHHAPCSVLIADTG